MTEEEKLKFVANMIGNGTNIGQFVVDNHGTMNYYAEDKKTSSQSVAHFPLNKSEDEGRQWYSFLIKNGFISEETEQVCWLYLLGFSSTIPDNIKPIAWLKTVETARLMLRKCFDNLISSNRMSVKEMGEIASQCFIKDGKPLKLAKPKAETSSDADLIEEFLPTISDH